MFSLSDIPASGLYFLTYEYVKEEAANRFGTSGSFGLLGTIFAGGMAGIANWSIGMPADVLKSRLQTGKTKHIITLQELVFTKNKKL